MRQSYHTEFGVEMRRITWQHFWALRPDLRPADNDNRPASLKEAA